MRTGQRFVSDNQNWVMAAHRRHRRKSEETKNTKKENNLVVKVANEGTSKDCAEYYERQKLLLESYNLDDECMKGGAAKDEEHGSQADKWISTVVLAVNISLLFAKAISTWLTHGTSLSIISTLLDSVMDIASGLVIWYATHLIINTDKWQYPRGRESLESMSILFLGALMGLANVQVFYDAMYAIIYGKPPPEITTVSFLILLGTILVKIVLYYWCSGRKSQSAQALAVDQGNDVMTNSVVILGAACSEFVAPVIDPITAAIVSGYIAYNWYQMVLEQMHQLLGGNCSSDELSRVTRVCILEEHVKCLDALLVYHVGQKLRVEVHVVTDPHLTIQQIHDELIEPLTTKLESLEFVDKAYVHPDHSLDGIDK